jgi:hypothetical protein
MVIVIVVIAVVVLVGGFLVARKGFVRGSMASTPSEDSGVPEPDGAEAKKDPDVSHDPTAVGRPSDRGYEQKLR